MSDPSSGLSKHGYDGSDKHSGDESELTLEQESRILTVLQEVQTSMHRLLDTMDNNLSLLEDSVREVRTARLIAAESNQNYGRLQRESATGPVWLF